MKVGITGQSGFLGNHLYHWLRANEVELVDFDKAWFEQSADLEAFVVKCDVIVHTAAMNRHEDLQFLHDTNVGLVEKLVEACKGTSSTPKIVFTSSSQEEQDNLYGQSKLKGKRLFEAWSNNGGGESWSLKIPNVFGPFGKPNYNSFIATFCHKIAHGEAPQVLKDGEVNLVYINDLIEVIRKVAFGEVTVDSKSTNFYELAVPHTATKKVTEVLALLNEYKEDYLEKGVFPSLDDYFEKSLFNTFRCYVQENHYPLSFTKHTDNRGAFVEIARTGSSGQFSYSTTVPGITRGNHYHTRKAERFAVINGKAKIELRRVGTDKVIEYLLDGEAPSFVDMPIWYTHNITNIGDEELVTLFWINEPYNPEDADTYFEEV